MKASMRRLGGRFSTSRMLMEYSEQFYLPALKHYDKIKRNDFGQAKELAEYFTRLHSQWSHVSIFDVHGGSDRSLKVGDSFPVECCVHLGSIAPDEVSVQVYTGRLTSEGELEDPEVVEMKVGDREDKGFRYKTKVRCRLSGRQAYAIRILPNHSNLVHPYVPGYLRWNT